MKFSNGINPLKRIVKFLSLTLIFSLCLGQNILTDLETNLANSNSTIIKIDLLNQLSLQTLKRDRDSSRTYAQRALALSDSTMYLVGKSVALRRLGQNERRAGDHQAALQFFKKALNTLNHELHHDEVARAYAEIGRSTAALSRPTEAIEKSQHALKIFTELKMDSSRSQVMNEIGYRYWSLDKFDSALVYLAGSLELIRDTDRVSMKARLINNIGAIHYKMGNFDVGLSHYIQALKLQKELENHYAISQILSNIGKIYVSMGGLEDAMQKYREALDYGKRSGNQSAIGYAQNNMGELFLSLGKLDSAQVFVDAALENYTKIGHSGGMINTMNNMGSIYLALNQLDPATQYVQKAKALSDSLKNYSGYTKSLSVLGDISLQQALYEQALSNYMASVEISSAHSLRIQLQEDYGKISSLYDQIGDTYHALEYFRLFTTLKDSLVSERVRDHLSALRIQYDTAEKEKENRQLLQLHEEQRLVIAKRTFILTLSGITTGVVLILLLILVRTSRNLKKANEFIGASEEKYRRLVENVNDAIVISQNDKFIYFNSQFSRMLGYSNDEMVTRDYRDIYAEAGLEILSKRDGIRQSGKVAPERYETYFKKKDGLVIEVEANVTIIKYNGQDATFAVIRDITERKQAEIQRQFLEKQLQQSRKLESMGTMIGGIAHEFNNILQSLFVYVDLIKEDVAHQPEIKYNFSMVEKGIKRAGELVKQILAFSRKTDINSQPNLLQDILPEAVSFVRASIPTNISIESEIDKSCKPVNCDITQIHQLILNLSNNAAIAMKDSGGVLTIQLNDLESDELSGGTKEQLVELMIRDNGQGMDAETQEKIFDPFYTTRNVGEGTGLGLSVVYGIVKQMKGLISVESELEVGTSFRMLFPTVDRSVDLNNKQDEDSDTPQEGKLNILLVDDEADIRKASSSLLQGKGFSVAVASSGKEALKILSEDWSAFDLIITDFTMPGMTGIEMVASIRAKGHRVPVILSSGILDPDLKESYKESGVDGFISKPWTGAQLLTSIRGLNLNS